MDLKTFISETLKAVVAGVSDAQRGIVDEHPTAAIVLLDRPSDEERFPNPQPSPVDFDIAITTAEETSSESGGKAGLKIYVVSADLGGKDAEKVRTEAVSRVRFSVPVHLPTMHSSAESDRRAKQSAENDRKIREHAVRVS